MSVFSGLLNWGSTSRTINPSAATCHYCSSVGTHTTDCFTIRSLEDQKERFRLLKESYAQTLKEVDFKKVMVTNVLRRKTLQKGIVAGSLGLSNVPLEFLDDTSIVSFYMDNNKLDKVPSLIGQLTNIQYLNLSNNKLGELPSEICFLTKVKLLDVSYNQIKQLPASIGQLRDVRMLNIEHNQITSLTPTVALMRSLQILNSEHNPLEWPPKSIMSQSLDSILKFLRGFAFKNLVNNKENSDVVFLVENNQIIYGHKALLHNRCPFFNFDDSPKQEIVVPVGGNVFILLLELLYNDYLEVPKVLVAEFKEACAKLGLEDILMKFRMNENYDLFYAGSGAIDFSHLYHDGQFSDVSFFVEDKIVKCHKVILSSRCEYFARMFLSGLAESSTNQVYINDASFEAFDAVIKALYASEVMLPTISDGQLLVDILMLANLYNVFSIQVLCEAELAENLDVENVATLLLIAEMHGCMYLGAQCKKYIRLNFDAVSKTEDFAQLSSTLISEIKQISV